jgi:hypothetical protein
MLTVTSEMMTSQSSWSFRTQADLSAARSLRVKMGFTRQNITHKRFSSHRRNRREEEGPGSSNAQKCLFEIMSSCKLLLTNLKIYSRMIDPNETPFLSIWFVPLKSHENEKASVCKRNKRHNIQPFLYV